MLQPKKYKFLKKQKGRIKGRFENRSNNLKFGVFGIQALEAGKLTARQIEAIRRTITNLTKREAKIWIRVFPDFPVTAKPTEIRMGRGKGSVDQWVCKVNKGRILFEVTGKNLNVLRNILNYTKIKFPFKVQIVTRSTDLE